MNKQQNLNQLAQKLLAALCMMAASAAVAAAGTITETTDWGNTFADATNLGSPSLPVTMIGSLCGDCTDQFDVFFLTGLTPGHSLQIVFLNQSTSFFTTNFLAEDSSQTSLASAPNLAIGANSTANLLAPADGKLYFQADSTYAYYSVTVTDLGGSTPEPAAAGMSALGLAMGACMLRKRKQAGRR